MAAVRDLATLQHEVAWEVRALQERLPEWAIDAGYADPASSLGALERRERERLERLERRERRAWRERTRTREARERTRPWLEQERFGLRKRLWRERRARERELLDRREQAVLDREQELRRWLARHRHWLGELPELEPESRAWCAEQERLVARGEVTVRMLAQLHERRREAAAARAQEILARVAVRAALGPALAPTPRDTLTIARVVTEVLMGMASAEGARGIPPPAVLAAVALEVARTGPALPG